ncbi:hypothetical protein [Brevibacillus porteri]|uniref:Uncharacterized protein n=1 Tax=Brevibacillus porteri TaxID=2126350 RepID=A0ABX5FKA4_9BACL|nr:hypothetical protein [Brevibacillus porteri]MED1802921.1 hypothetical protein [Brevibacillus porteri]MED2135097.1 hypothetical protein [Brevibacillus porteri]MED2746339.1 hypothetical protein [Brevibacillus porteri]MED2817923.1 hypothetical protein [Brevibacillus porteri]MED2895555.1 hypothetical protein [Brevibacillus porteri]
MENKTRYLEVGFVCYCGCGEVEELDVMIIFEDDNRSLIEIQEEIGVEDFRVFRELTDPMEIIEALTESHIDMTIRLMEESKDYE